MRNILVISTDPQLIALITGRLQTPEYRATVSVAIDSASLRHVETPFDCVVVDMDDQQARSLLDTIEDVRCVSPNTRILACTRRPNSTAGSDLWELGTVGNGRAQTDDLSAVVGSVLDAHRPND